MTAKMVDFYFDFGSPAAWLAYAQLPDICREAGATLALKPVLLGGVFKTTGNQSPAETPAKRDYLMQDLERCAKRGGVDYKLNPHFPINTVLLMRAATAVQMDEGDARLRDYCDLVFPAMWVDSRNLGEPVVVDGLLQSGGFDAQALLARVTADDVKQQLKTLTDAAVERGIFGAPTMFVGDEMFWGQDRLDFVRDALAAT